MGSAMDRCGYKRVSSNGNHVYVGNFDADGLNVNNNWDDNRNDNLGLAARRQSTPNRQAADFYSVCCFSSARCQPPSIFPTSVSISASEPKALVPMVFVSQASCKKNFSASSLVDARWVAVSFWVREVYPASRASSSVSVKRVSIFTPSVYRASRGNLGSNPSHVRYASRSFCTIGISLLAPKGGGKLLDV